MTYKILLLSLTVTDVSVLTLTQRKSSGLCVLGGAWIAVKHRESEEIFHTRRKRKWNITKSTTLFSFYLVQSHISSARAMYKRVRHTQGNMKAEE
jgi:hypothetical protein